MAENSNDENKSFQNEYLNEILRPLTIYINEDLKSTDPFVREQAMEMQKEKNKLMIEFAKKKFEMKLQIERETTERDAFKKYSEKFYASDHIRIRDSIIRDCSKPRPTLTGF